MSEYPVLFLLFSLLLISGAKSTKEIIAEDENKSNDFKIESSDFESDKDGITIYIDKDDFISELKRLYKPELNIKPTVQLVKDTDNGSVRRIIFKKSKGSVQVPETEERTEEINTPEETENKSGAANVVGTEEESRITDSEKSSTPEVESESNTSASEDERSGDPKDISGDDFEDPRNSKPTEEYSKTVPMEETKSDVPDDVTPAKRSTDTSHLNTEDKAATEETGNEIVSVPETEKTIEHNHKGHFKRFNENLSVINPVMAHQNFHEVSPFGKSGSVDSVRRSAEPIGISDIHDDQLDKSAEMKSELTKGDYSSDSHENEYPYSPPGPENQFQHALTEHHRDRILAKLSQASEHPIGYPTIRSKIGSGEGLRNYGRFLPYYIPNRFYIQPFGAYNIHRPVRFPLCNGC